MSGLLLCFLFLPRQNCGEHILLGVGVVQAGDAVALPLHIHFLCPGEVALLGDHFGKRRLIHRDIEQHRLSLLHIGP